MQLSIPSKRRAARFIVVFYAATALLFFGFYTVFAWGFFGPPSPANAVGFVLEIVLRAAVWPQNLLLVEIEAVLLLLGLATGALEPRVMVVGN